VFNETIIHNEALNLKLSTGKMARQAGGAVIVEAGDTVVMATVCSARQPKPGLDFFPLTVDYREKMYAAGKIPGGFFKREARPTTRETLVSRLIDRPIRPLFPDKYHTETQIVVHALAYDQTNQPDVLAIIGASAALSISDCPFSGPVGAVRIGYVDGKLVINPTVEDMKTSRLDLVVAGTRKAITMVESEASVLSEDIYLEALALAHEHIKKVCDLIDELRAKAGKAKVPFTAPTVHKDFYAELQGMYAQEFRNSFRQPTKLDREQKASDLKAAIMTQLAAKFEAQPELAGLAKEYLHDIEYDVIRKMIVEEKARIDGRAIDEIRPIAIEVDVLKRVHGSALFTRGETQALAVLTLGGGDDEQYIDGLDETTKDRFLLHYNFPPFSVGEVGRYGFTGRREIGHGELACKALRAVVPDASQFPYTLRLVSEIMESNGSSSMATVCSCALAMMAGGVPVKAPVAGVAMGLFMLGDQYTVLTDIQGAEDHYGDMDFKVAGTTDGITALQMDIKIEGISIEIMRHALAEAKKSRMFLLGKMTEVITNARPNISQFAPRILMLNIPKEKIGEVIGPGGKVIRRLSEEYGVKIEVTEEGNRGIVKVLSVDGPSGEGALEALKAIVTEPEVGKIYYNSKVKRVESYGAFCEFMPGREGLVHVSKISKKERLKSASDILAEGDFISLKLLEVDKQGRFNLSAVDVPENDF